MPTISSAAPDPCAVHMTGLDAFDSAVELKASQLSELIDRARKLKHSLPPEGPPGLLSGVPEPRVDAVLALQHPVHVLADLLAMRERSGLPWEQIAFCCTGDGSSALAQSLMLAGTALGMDVRIAAPARYWPTDGAVAKAHHLAAASRAGLLITANAVRGTDGAHFLVAVPFGPGQVASTISETARLAHRPLPVRALSEEQAANRLWVLEAVLADWLATPGWTWSRSAQRPGHCPVGADAGGRAGWAS